MAIAPPHPRTAALITGASSGIGRELATQLSERGHATILVARRKDRLERLADELRSAHGRRVEVLACDLSDSADRDRLTRSAADLGLEVNVLVCCAGFGIGGRFVDQDPCRVQSMIRTNLEATVGLARHFAAQMARRKSGSVLIVSSILGTQPTPNIAVYAATKAAVTSFAEALNEELRSDHVTVTALCPGSVQTEFHRVADTVQSAKRLPPPLMALPGDVARTGLAALDAGRRTVIPGWGPRLLNFTSGHMPRRLWLPIAKRLMS